MLRLIGICLTLAGSFGSGLAFCREKRSVSRKKTEDELGTRGTFRFFLADSAKKSGPSPSFRRPKKRVRMRD